MAKAILNNVLTSGNEDEAVRDGYYVRKPDGRVQITQKALVAFNAAQDKMERLAGLLRDGLQNKSASVEVGGLDAGLFVEPNYNYDREYLKAFAAKLEELDVDVDALKKSVKDEAGKKKSNPRLRVWDTVNDKTPKGERTAPVDEAIKPVAPVREDKSESA